METLYKKNQRKSKIGCTAHRKERFTKKEFNAHASGKKEICYKIVRVAGFVGGISFLDALKRKICLL
jgi:hypothetical protein